MQQAEASKPEALLSPEMVDDIAQHVANKWRKKGIKSYSYEDIYQDAVVSVLHAATRWNPECGTPIRAYCYSAAYYNAHYSITRAIAPVSAKGHDKVRELGENTRKVPLVVANGRHTMGHRDKELVDAPPFADEDGLWTAAGSDVTIVEVLHRCAVVGRARVRIWHLIRDVTNKELGFRHVVEGVTASQLEREGWTRGQVKAAGRAVRRKIQNDRVLYNLVKEMR